MPRLRQVSRHETDGELTLKMYDHCSATANPVAEPGTATGTPGVWWTVFALLDRHAAPLRARVRPVPQPVAAGLIPAPRLGETRPVVARQPVRVLAALQVVPHRGGAAAGRSFQPNLATPLHRTAACAATPKPFQPAQSSSGCRSRLRHIRPTQPGGSASAGHVTRGWSSMPFLANTALPEPVMRLLPKCLASHSAACATSGHRSSAGGWRSFRP